MPETAAHPIRTPARVAARRAAAAARSRAARLDAANRLDNRAAHYETEAEQVEKQGRRRRAETYRRHAKWSRELVTLRREPPIANEPEPSIYEVPEPAQFELLNTPPCTWVRDAKGICGWAVIGPIDTLNPGESVLVRHSDGRYSRRPVVTIGPLLRRERCAQIGYVK